MEGIKLKFCGGVGEVTGANYLLTYSTSSGQEQILVDCGMFQGPPESERKNWEPFPYDPKYIDAVFITHAHLDHIGRLPKLYRDGFRGKVFATAPTIDLARLSLKDAVHLQKDRARSFGLEPFFNEKDMIGVFKLFEVVNYGKPIRISANIEAEFLNAGHILGSAMVRIQIQNPCLTGRQAKSKTKTTTIVFTGDLGNWPVPVMHPPEFISEADYIIIESTYGDRTHEPVLERKEKVERAIESVAESRGALMIPSFALERTQELLFELNELVENRRVPRMPIFLDSPMASKATKIYKKHPNFYNRKAACIVRCGDDFFDFPGFKVTKNVFESKKINSISPPKVIIAGSGMMTGGRIQHHLARYLPDPKSYLLIINYQAKGTLGREIFEIGYGKSKQREVEILGQKVPVRCKVRAVGAYSSHADREQLREFIKHIRKPIKKVFVVQGEKEVSESFALLLKDHLGITAAVPEFGEEAIL